MELEQVSIFEKEEIVNFLNSRKKEFEPNYKLSDEFLLIRDDRNVYFGFIKYSLFKDTIYNIHFESFGINTGNVYALLKCIDFAKKTFSRIEVRVLNEKIKRLLFRLGFKESRDEYDELLVFEKEVENEKTT